MGTEPTADWSGLQILILQGCVKTFKNILEDNKELTLCFLTMDSIAILFTNKVVVNKINDDWWYHSDVHIYDIVYNASTFLT